MLADLDITHIRSLEDALDCIFKLFDLVETLSQENQRFTPKRKTASKPTRPESAT